MTIVLKEKDNGITQWVIELHVASPKQLLYLLSSGTFAEIPEARETHRYQPWLDKSILEGLSVFPTEDMAVAAGRRAADRYKKAVPKARFSLTAIPVTIKSLRQLTLHEAYRSPFLYDTQITQ